MIQIDLDVLFWALVVIFAIAIGVVLFIAILKMIRVLGKIDNIITESENSIKITLKNASEITDNAKKITSDAKNVTGEIGDVATSVKSSSKSVMESTSIMTDLILTAIKIIRKKLV